MSPIQTVAHYRIVSKLGEGGMGAVYRATDTKLNRDVAVKVLPPAFAEDAARMQRFEREAQVLASLNHPNIAQIYGIEQGAIVMELVEGEDLKGPVPLDAALEYAKQIAAGLEAAHEKGIVHRDLKPANIKVKPDGTVKVLDFGLAKLAPASAGDAENSPTLSMAATQMGVILGTAGYMSPEQARGRPIDKRADNWAFGVVLYELLTGRRLFQGEDITETLASVVKEAPDLNQVPTRVRPLLQRCLEKDPKKRLRDIGDAMALLAEEAAPARADAPTRAKLPWAIAAGLAVVAAVAFWGPWRRPPAEPPVTRFQIPAPAKSSVIGGFSPSPDGRWIAFAAVGAEGRPMWWVRSLDVLQPRPLPGTEGASAGFWSPDSKSIAFFADGKLQKIEISGGPSQTICSFSGQVVGGFWTRDDVIVFGAAGAGLFRVPAAGGTPAVLTALDPKRQDVQHFLPTLLPDQRHFLYLRVSTRSENTGIYAGSLDAKPSEQSSKLLLPTRFGAVYAPPSGAGRGNLLFLRDGTLMAQPFDTGRLELTGAALPVAENVGAFLNGGYFGASATVLAYQNGTPGGTQLTWVDRQGKPIGTTSETSLDLSVALSPDGARAATTRGDVSLINADIWITEFARGTSTQLTFDPALDALPLWSPDGSRIVFTSARDGVSLYQKAASGAGTDELLLKSSARIGAEDWSRDGRFLLYTLENPKTKFDLWILPDPLKKGGNKPQLFLGTQANEQHGRFSPDTRWIAYTSDGSGVPEIYVRPFPVPAGGGGLWRVSNGGGSQPHWRGDGKELFYISGDNKVMAVEVSASAGGSEFQVGIAKPLFGAPAFQFISDYPNWDVARDGQRFLFITPTAGSSQVPFTAVTNWQSLLKK